MSRIAQAYIHTSYAPAAGRLESWGRQTEDLSHKIARRVFPSDTEIVVSFEPGSLKARATILMGSVLAVYGAIATYPDFKSGLSEAIRDAREFAGPLNDQLIDALEIPKESVVRRERRTETPGRLKRAIDRLESLEGRISETPQTQIERELRLIARQLRAGLSDLDDNERQLAIGLIEAEHQPRLPQPIAPRLAIRPREFELNLDKHLMLRPRRRLHYRGYVRTDEPLTEEKRLASPE